MVNDPELLMQLARDRREELAETMREARSLESLVFRWGAERLARRLDASRDRGPMARPAAPRLTIYR